MSGGEAGAWTGQFVGRTAELDRLRALVADVGQGAGRTASIVGPPGIGKSALVRALLASTDDATPLVGRCAPPPSTPLRPLTELAIAAVAAGADPAVADDTIFRVSVHRLLGGGGGAEVDGHHALLLGEALRLLLGSLPAAPVVLVVEDLHWADDETLAVLDYLVDHVGSDPVAVLCTSRAFESPAADGVLAGWTRRRVGEAITLEPLDRAAVEALVGQLAPASDAAFVAAVAAASEGSPLLVEAFSREAAAGDTSVPALSVPATYVEAVVRRLSSLPPERRWGIELAALAGRDLDRTGLSRLGVDDPERVIDDAVRSQLAEPGRGPEPARFRHQLTREAVVATLADSDRRALATEALHAFEGEELDDRELEVASQLASASGDLRRASELLIQSARRAVAMGATSTALARLDAAAELTDADALHGPVIREYRVEALAMAGRATEAIELGEQLAHELADRRDPVRLGRVQLALARACGGTSDWDAAARRLDEAFPDLQRAPTDVLSFRAICAIELGRVDEARAIAERALSREPIDAVAECESREVLGRVARETSYAGAADQFRAGVAAAVGGGLDLWRARSLLELGLCEATLYGRAATFEAAAESARHSGAMALSAMCDYNLANLYGLHFRPDEAIETAERAIETASRIASPVLEALGWITLGQAYGVRGERGKARLAGDRARSVAPGESELEGLAIGMCDAFADLLTGDVDAACEGYAASLETLLALPVPTATSPWYFGPLTLAVAGHELVPAIRAQLDAPSFRAVPTLAAIAELMDAVEAGRRDPAAVEPHLDALRAYDERHVELVGNVAGPWLFMRMVVAPSAIEHGWGTPLDDLDRAERWLREHGLDAAARWCTALLRDAGVGPRRRGKARADVPEALAEYGLTNREFEVLELLGERLTNREIAERLVVSPSTVKTHVERLLAKTGRADRVELAELVTAVG